MDSRVTQFCAVVGLLFTGVLAVLQVKQMFFADASDLTYRFEEVSCSALTIGSTDTKCILKVWVYNQGRRRADDVELEVPYGKLFSHSVLKASELVTRGDGQVLRLFNIPPGISIPVDLTIVRRTETKPTDFVSLDVTSKDGSARQLMEAPWDLSFWDFMKWPLTIMGVYLMLFALWRSLETPEHKRRRLNGVLAMHQDQRDRAKLEVDKFEETQRSASKVPETPQAGST